MNWNDEIRCIKCGSTNVDIHERGFSYGDAALGGILFGWIGVLLGGFRADEIRMTCRHCGETFTKAQWKEFKKGEEYVESRLSRIADSMAGEPQEKIEDAQRAWLEKRNRKQKNISIAQGVVIVLGLVAILYALITIVR